MLRFEIRVCLCLIALLMVIQLRGTESRSFRGRNYYNNDDDDDIVEESVDDPQSSHPQDGDGYDEPDPDEKYEETPQDSESQAELERFFDDHLGASDRDGMDKENLPTNAIPFVLSDPKVLSESEISKYMPVGNGIDRHDDFPLIKSDSNNVDEITQQENIKLKQATGDLSQHSTNIVPVELRISRGDDNDEPTTSASSNNVDDDDKADDNEDEEAQKIYITSMNKEPFTIDQLGGYNPEADFKGLSDDLERAQPYGDTGEEEAQVIAERKKTKLNGNESKQITNPRQVAQRRDDAGTKDIDFNNDEDIFASDNSETDDAAFEADDPYIDDKIESSFQSNLYLPSNGTDDGRQSTPNY